MPTVPDPQIADWCTASNPNPGAELQSGRKRRLSSSIRLRTLVGRRVLRIAVVAVRGPMVPTRIGVPGPGIANAVPARAAALAILGPIATESDSGGIMP